jgi:MSHA biogenesis protein MshI
MRWPWQRNSSPGRLAVSWTGQSLAYVQAKADVHGHYHIEKIGVERQGSDSMDSFLDRVQNLDLHGGEVLAMLRPDQYQLLQIDAPAVAPEEMRSAARYQIRDMLDTHVDDFTLDVMKVGDGQQKGVAHLFVVVATNLQVREVLELGRSLHWPVSVIDVQEVAQRNLQNAMASLEGTGARAHAALVVTADRQALLTITANDELFYSRRLDLPEGFMALEWSDGEEVHFDSAGHHESHVSSAGYMPVTEYVPDYSNSTPYGYEGQPSTTGRPGSMGTGRERSQRLLVEVQRSLDLWDRTWTGLPLAGLRVYAGDRSLDLAVWLSQELGQTVLPMDLSGIFGGLEDTSAETLMSCLPLLGTLLRTGGAS